MPEKWPTILQIIPELDTGGAERTTVEMAEAIVTAGGRAIVLSAGGRLVAELTATGAEHITFPAAAKKPWSILANARAIARLVKRERVDLIHARSRAPAWSALIAARRTRTHFVTTYHGIYNEKGRMKRTYNSVMARGELVIANSLYTAELVRTRYGTNPSRIVVINRGVDIERFDRRDIAADRIAALRAAWRIEEGHRIVLHPARLTRWKGQPVVIDAAKLLARRSGFERVVFILAGDAQGRDSYAAELKAQIASAGLGERVRLVGHIADMPAALALSDMVLIASTEPEAFGRTSVEAQAMGVPVIATSIGAPPYTVLAPPAHAPGASTGRHVPPRDSVALADAIAEILSLPPDEREAMSARARVHAQRNYTTRQLQESTLGVYDRLLGTDLAARFAAAIAAADAQRQR